MSVVSWADEIDDSPIVEESVRETSDEESSLEPDDVPTETDCFDILLLFGRRHGRADSCIHTCRNQKGAHVKRLGVALWCGATISIN